MPNKKALTETMCGITVRKGGDDLPEIGADDLVFVVRDVYSSIGEPTKSGSLAKGHKDYKNTRSLATNGARWTWLGMGSDVGNHASGRKVGIHIGVMLASPAKGAKKGSDKKAPVSSMDL